MSSSDASVWVDVSQVKPAALPESLRDKWLRWMAHTGLKHMGKAFRIYGAWRRHGMFIAFADACDAAAEAMKGERVFAD